MELNDLAKRKEPRYSQKGLDALMLSYLVMTGSCIRFLTIRVGKEMTMFSSFSVGLFVPDVPQSGMRYKVPYRLILKTVALIGNAGD